MTIMCQVQAAARLTFGSALLIGVIPKTRQETVLVIISNAGGNIDTRELRTKYSAALLESIIILPVTEWLLQFRLRIIIFQKQNHEKRSSHADRFPSDS